MDENGITASYTYGDSAGDLTAVSYPGHTDQNVTGSYDSYGRLTNTTDAQSSYSETFGDRDEMVTGTRTYTGIGAKTITFTYNPDGSRATMQLPVAPSGYSNANCYTYAYDAGQRLTGITDNLGNTSTFRYGNNDWLLGQNSANGLTAAFTRNALGQGTDLLNQMTSGGATSSVSEFDDAAYDGVGNLTSVTSSIAASGTLSGTRSFGYDGKDQLTSESNGSTGAGYSNSFAYDSAGNATTFRGASRSFNSSNQFSGSGFVYDSAGNPTTYAGSTCTFDVFNRATSLGTALTAGYRSDGLRAWKQDSSGNRTYYLYDGDSPLCEMDASGSWKGEFLYGPAGLISHSRSGLGTVFFAYDALGSVQSVWRDTGTLVSSRVYDAYGEQTGGIVADATHDDPTIGYNGQSGYITDPETSLVLCGHRYYDPSAGRWLNRDPIGYSGGIGLYNYCANNPVMLADPLGLVFPGFSSSGGNNLGFGGGLNPIDPWANNNPPPYTMDPPPFDPYGDFGDWCVGHPFEAAMTAGSILDGLGEAALADAAGDAAIVGGGGGGGRGGGGGGGGGLPSSNFPHFIPNPGDTPFIAVRTNDAGDTLAVQYYDEDGYATARADYGSRSGRTDHEFPHYHPIVWPPNGRTPRGNPTIGPAMPGEPPNSIIFP